MDNLVQIQQALDFMETHLLEPIGYGDAARAVYLSSYHFHRLFTMLAGVTPTEYLKQRRLSLAGRELSLAGTRVLDVALKYGYESPESFTKAFSRFHGVTPNAAKRPGVTLRFFQRLVITVSLEGGTAMEYQVLERDGFQLLGKVRAFPNECAAEEGSLEIPAFWDQCRTGGVFDTLSQATGGRDLYGVCAPISKESPCFDYGIAMEYGGGPVPEGYRVLTVKPALWAVFRCMGEDGACVAETWARISKEFIPASGYNILDALDLERYPAEDAAGCFCEIWVPVEKQRS